MNIIKNTLKTIAIMAIVFGCKSNVISAQKNDDLNELKLLKAEIELLISKGTCSENSECDFIAFGSKPCGGPWRYLAFSNTINVKLLKVKVTEYNKKEDTYNKKWGVSSDCSMATPPKNVKCVDGICIAIF